ncbi:hypothetical protein HJ588_10260 [Flexivirga sp. ID2601S]|uniref:Uncharacterized protein n=1 Tax=Flexivirga aerilata TaxID=1656889 RepID=A0A849AI89_9MICO|nr:hypothetical protein [Flexivirga aerilata]NNG39653.1 hypothetical protein [Flexivirga aerilata]
MLDLSPAIDRAVQGPGEVRMVIPSTSTGGVAGAVGLSVAPAGLEVPEGAAVVPADVVELLVAALLVAGPSVAKLLVPVAMAPPAASAPTMPAMANWLREIGMAFP